MTPLTRSYTASATQAPLGGTITLHAAMTDTWSDSLSYKFELSGGTTLATTTNGTATVSFSSPGTYEVWAYAIPANGSASQGDLGYISIKVVAPTQLTANESVTAIGALGVEAVDTGTTGSWNIAKVSFDFGDGTAPVTAADGTQVEHT